MRIYKWNGRNVTQNGNTENIDSHFELQSRHRRRTAVFRPIDETKPHLFGMWTHFEISILIIDPITQPRDHAYETRFCIIFLCRGMNCILIEWFWTQTSMNGHGYSQVNERSELDRWMKSKFPLYAHSTCSLFHRHLHLNNIPRSNHPSFIFLHEMCLIIIISIIIKSKEATRPANCFSICYHHFIFLLSICDVSMLMHSTISISICVCVKWCENQFKERTKTKPRSSRTFSSYLSICFWLMMSTNDFWRDASDVMSSILSLFNSQ